MGITFNFTGVSAANKARIQKAVFPKYKSLTIDVYTKITDANIKNFLQEKINSEVHALEAATTKKDFYKNFVNPL